MATSTVQDALPAGTDAARLIASLQHALEEAKTLHGQMGMVLDALPIGVAIVSGEGRFLFANRLLAEAAGQTATDLLGQPLEATFGPEGAGQLRAMGALAMAGDAQVREGWTQVSAGGEARYLHQVSTPWWDHAGRVAGFFLFRVDLTAHKQAEERLVWEARHDRLTGLMNRTCLVEQLEQTAPPTPFALIVLDLDRFRYVNDSLGHGAGDELLVRVARRLRGMAGTTATLARLGGDEFALLVTGELAADRASALADRVMGGLREPVNLRGHEVFTGASMGIVIGAAGERRAEAILADADLALYRAKGGGRGRIAYFESQLREHSGERLLLETELRRGLERGEFELHYQPTISLATGALCGFEALARWRHPERGMVAPNRFIPVAEETGLIVPLGRQVLETAAAQAAIWSSRTRGAAPVVAVNVSAQQFTDSDLVDDVRSVLAATGASPDLLKLELTESLLMAQPDLAADALRSLRDQGVKLAIDDFGTGYSSLSYLHRFPFDTLKIDRSFVSTMLVRAESMAVVRAVTSLAKALSMQTVAEGAETRDEAAKLAEIGCDLCQGFYFSRPLPLDQADELLTAGKRYAVD